MAPQNSHIYIRESGLHACNPGYSEGRDQEIAVQSQHKQIVPEILSQKHSSQKRANAVA
jgi:hypothetical protein